MDPITQPTRNLKCNCVLWIELFVPMSMMNVAEADEEKSNCPDPYLVVK